MVRGTHSVIVERLRGNSEAAADGRACDAVERERDSACHVVSWI